ncbi:hypothetical protein M0802_009375 [Mischocyttarus mexicanus]|nr:hypothetical protein M0802_009375 [Mischocyttarus mexicanus]
MLLWMMRGTTFFRLPFYGAYCLNISLPNAMNSTQLSFAAAVGAGSGTGAGVPITRRVTTIKRITCVFVDN